MSRRFDLPRAALAAALCIAAAGPWTAPAVAPAADHSETPPAAYAGPTGRSALSGPWTVRLDPSNHGALKGFQAGAYNGGAVTVPHAANGRPVTGEAGVRSFRGSVAWYRTTFTVPTDGDYAVRFESVHHKATVWIDGYQVGRHKGAYLPFEYRASLVSGTKHTLVVRADWRGPSAMKRDGWHRTWFNFGGINREVTIRRLAASALTAPTVHTRLTADGAIVDVTVHVRNRERTPREIPVAGTLVRDGERYELAFPTLRIDARTTNIVHAQATIPKPALWSPDAPNLYDLELTVPEESGYRVRVGLRELDWRGTRLFLNGRRLRLHGASLHEDVRDRGDALTAADMDAIVSSLKAIGANATRSQHQLNPALLERFDAAGILVWMGLGPVDAPGSWTSKLPHQRRVARERVRRTLFQTQAHPSIIAWNLANEVAGNGHSGGQAEFIDDMARELHRRDPGRLVAVDVWGAHPPKRMGLLYRDVDAIAVTNYVGWYEHALSPRAVVRRAIRERVREFRKVFAGKVLVISEFGAEANALNASQRPGGFGYQAWLLREHINAYSADPGLAGQLIWNLRDFAVSPAFAGGSIRRLVPGIQIVRGVNQKGLFDFDGKPKPAVAAVRAAFAPLGDGLTG